MKKRTKAFLGIIISIALVIILGITNIIPYFAVIPDMVKVGIDYISLDKNKNSVSKTELKNKLDSIEIEHPFILANSGNFETVRTEVRNNSFSPYTKSLYLSAISNADALLDTDIYPVIEYVLDEEDSILPISREVINRMIILGYAWQISGDMKYAERAWKELENVCSYDDWCNSHFLASAEMALAVSIGYDWFFDYLNDGQKALLSEKTWDYAIDSALNDNHWFTWSKNNWNSICYSGIGIACMAFAENNPEAAAKFLEMG